MSLFGYFVAARTERSLLELECVRKACEEGTPQGERAGGGWRLLQIHRGTGLRSDHVCDETGGPAVVLYVIESAVALLDAWHPDGPDVLGTLNPADAMRAFDMSPEHAGSVETTTAASVAWAQACGLHPDPEAIAAAVGKYVGPFGEGVMDYLAALGLEFASEG